ncbi:MAG TPA: alkaline phosphatase [Pirellulales bacterium]|jgi:alkaline phosphatase|nr:alkaline phosphatase [Pirellulales bacterium]
MLRIRFVWFALVVLALSGCSKNSSATPSENAAADQLRQMQAVAIEQGNADWGYWGPQPSKYTGWTTHSNRLIPVYIFGMDLNSVRGEHSVYRNSERLQQLYGYLPAETLNPQAEYFDETDIYHLQEAAVAQGKQRIILFIFDGMDWFNTWAAACYKTGTVPYHEGRGSGLHFQDYRGAPTDFGYMVTSPHNEGTKTDVNAQVVNNVGGKTRSGYDWKLAGETPWATPIDPEYPIGKSRQLPHPYTDSAASATSMNSGIKTYNDAINVDSEGNHVETIAQQLQHRGWSVGAVTSVSISDATPAATYANNVWRDDYQDISRDLVGLPSISHRQQPLPGLDVIIGTGWGETTTAKTLKKDVEQQGENFVSGNRYITTADLEKIDVDHGGKYKVVQRQSGMNGRQALAAAAAAAAATHERLLGLFGAGDRSHLPYRTADGNYNPTVGVKKTQEHYTPADIEENPRLTDVALAALEVLSQNPKGLWLMIEAGDVDWANHDDNLDNSLGAIFDGDDAVRAVTHWVETHGGWDNTVLIVTADHGHYFHITRPEAIAEAGKK